MRKMCYDVHRNISRRRPASLILFVEQTIVTRFGKEQMNGYTRPPYRPPLVL